MNINENIVLFTLLVPLKDLFLDILKGTLKFPLGIIKFFVIFMKSFMKL